MSYNPYPFYQIHPSEWVRSLPTHWKIGRLRWLSRRYSGGTPDKQNSHYWNEGSIPWLNSGAVNQFTITEPSTYITDDAFNNSSAKWIPKGSLVMALAGQGKTKGMVAQLAIDSTCNQSMAAIIPATSVHPRYLLWWLTSNYQNIRNMAGGDDRDGLNLDLLGAISTPLPPFPEQANIATFLDRETAKIDALVEEQERLIELLKEKRRTVVCRAVTKGMNVDAKMKDSGVEWLGKVPEHWRVTKLGRFISILSGFAFPSNGFSLDEQDTRLLRGINVGVGELKWEEVVYWPREANDDLGRFELKPGQIVVGMDRPWISDGVRVARVSESDLPCLLLQRVTALTVGGEMSEDFVYRLLSSDLFVSYFTPDMTGVSVPHLSPEQISNFVVAVPPLAEQEQIATHISRTMDKLALLLKEARDAIVLLQEHRSALIFAAVTGKIDVREIPDSSSAHLGHRDAARSAVALAIIARFSHRQNFGRVKLQKFLYLTETFVEVAEMAGRYDREAAGPLDRAMLSEIETGLQRSGMISVEQPDGRGGQVTYRILRRENQYSDDLASGLGDRKRKFDHLLDKLGDLDTKPVEAIATLFAVWNDFMIDGQTPTDNVIVSSVLNDWHPEKREKFTADELRTWLEWMRRHEIVPHGHGPRTSTGRLFT